MTSQRISLQNTPSVAEVADQAVSFERQGTILKGRLYLPANPPATATGRLPAAVVTGAWTTVKEQMAGTYARELARRGFAALAFDFTGWGESHGDARYLEDPATKTADIAAAIEFLAQRDDIDPARISGLGICASSGYMADAVAGGAGLHKLALVAAWLHDPAMAQEIYGGADSAAALIATGQAAAAASEPQIIEAASTTNPDSLMYQAPYYTEPERGLIAAYDNKFNLASWQPWLSYDGQASADTLTTPTLIVCSDAAALPAGARAYAKRTKASVTERWLDDVSQFDFYDRMDVVTDTADAVAQHFA